MYEVKGYKTFEILKEVKSKEWKDTHERSMKRIFSIMKTLEGELGIKFSIEEGELETFGVKVPVLRIKAPILKFDMITATSSDYGILMTELNDLEYYKRLVCMK